MAGCLQKMRALGFRSVPAGPRAATRAHPLGLARLGLVSAASPAAARARRLAVGTPAAR
jgi:hypothetical protein